MPDYLSGFNFDPNQYLKGASLGQDMSQYQVAGGQYSDALNANAMSRLNQILYQSNPQRAGLIGGIGGQGQSRSMMMGGAGAGRLQQFDTGVGQQVGQVGTDLNQQLGQVQMGQQQQLMDARNQALQQAMWQRAQGVGGFDIGALGLSALNAMPGLGSGLSALGRMF